MRVKKVLALGVTQRAVADRLGVSESWLSRWLEAKPGAKIRPMSLPEKDRLDAYMREAATVFATEETQRPEVTADPPRATGTAGSVFHTSDRRAINVGPPAGVSERRR